MRTVCRRQRLDRFFLAPVVSFLGRQHPSRTERRTNCHLPEYNRFDQIALTWIFLSVPAYLVSQWRLYQRHRLTSMLSSIPFWLIEAWRSGRFGGATLSARARDCFRWL